MKNYIWTAEMKWKWNDRRSERNLCNCVKKPEKNSGLQPKMISLSMDKENSSLTGVQKTSATASKPLLSFAAFWLRKEDDHSKYFKPSVAKRLKNMGIHSLPHIEIFWDTDIFVGMQGFKQRFKTLGRYLHLVSPSNEDLAHLHCEVRSLVTLLEQRFADA